MLITYLKILITAMIPIGELRVAIPLGIFKYGLSAPEAYIVSVIGNMIPVIFLLLFLEVVSKYLMEKSSFFNKFFNWLFSRTRKKIETKYKILGYIALTLFIATPLPITGAWTGSAAAYLLGLKFWTAFALISAGIMISGLIVTFASLGIIAIF
jgi:uncharacterized membrane protein